MKQFLLAAEADKIQDFVFRSSRLREVVGASQLLTRFCQEGLPLLYPLHGGEEGIDAPVNDGGSFRIIFTGNEADDVEGRAARFGADLAELYRLTVDGSLSVAQPVPMADTQGEDDAFKKANEQAGDALRRAKEHRLGAVAEAHMPFIAFCASCGVALAERYGTLAGEQETERDRYLCRSCRRKADERGAERQEWLDKFISEVITGQESSEHWQDWLETFKREVLANQGVADCTCPQDADAVGEHDSRNYVAYLVADGNGMGEIFGQCNSEQIKELSQRLSDTVRACLARPTRMFMRQNPLKYNEAKTHAVIPVLPLILGGDDLFTLLPAPYALDFARRFCEAYEEKVGQLLDEVFKREFNPRPTVSAAVVICKSKYPYALAHRRAEALLKEAKRRTKRRAEATGVYQSSINFEVILGNRLAGQGDEEAERQVRLRASLKPYWISRSTTTPGLADWGVDLATLIEQRYELRNVPQKRLVLVRRHFHDLWDEYFAPISPPLRMGARHNRLEQSALALERIRTRSGRKHQASLQTALEKLGKPMADGPHKHYWGNWNDHPNDKIAQGMPDLLEAWDYALSLDRAKEAYELQEEDGA